MQNLLLVTVETLGDPRSCRTREWSSIVHTTEFCRNIRRNRVAPTASMTNQPSVTTRNHAPQPRPIPVCKLSTPVDNTVPGPSSSVDICQPHVMEADPAVASVQSPVVLNASSTPLKTRSGRQVKPRDILDL